MIEPEPLWEINHSKTKRASGAKRKIKMIDLEELANLLRKYAQNSSSSEPQQIKAQIIEKLSASYWWTSLLMTRLFPEQTYSTKSELQLELTKKLDSGSARFTDINKLAKYLLREAVDLNKIFQKKIIGDDVINGLAAEAKRTPANSDDRRKIIQVLSKAIYIGGVFKRTGLGEDKFNLSSTDFKDAYEEAKGEATRYVLSRIDAYDESKSLMALINYWMPNKFKDAATKIEWLKKSQAKVEDDKKVRFFPQDPTSASFTNQVEENNGSFSDRQDSELIKQTIEKDPKNILGKTIRKDRPEMTFKKVLIAKFWDDKSDRDLSVEWDIPYTTIRSFYLRELEKIKLELAEYLQ
jgi:hypothetical protein